MTVEVRVVGDEEADEYDDVDSWRFDHLAGGSETILHLKHRDGTSTIYNLRHISYFAELER